MLVILFSVVVETVFGEDANRSTFCPCIKFRVKSIFVLFLLSSPHDPSIYVDIVHSFLNILLLIFHRELSSAILKHLQISLEVELKAPISPKLVLFQRLRENEAVAGMQWFPYSISLRCTSSDDDEWWFFWE